jgi:DNA-binding NarL/FixJ family response regulator
VITDLRIPVRNGIELAIVFAHATRGRIVLFLVEESLELVETAIRAGVDVFIDKK